MEPKSYLGVDIINGPGVDEISNVEELVERFGPGAFDVVISTEMIEHVAEWQAAVSNLKRVAAPEGVILLTTRSKGFPLHDYPADHWRFEPEDMRVIFSDCVMEQLEKDAPQDPGVFVKVRKPSEFQELDLGGYALYSMVSNGRAVTSENANRVVAEAARLRDLEERVLRLQEEAAAQAMTLQLVTSEAASARTQIRDMQQLRILRYTAPLRRVYGSARVALLSRRS
jgi:SAM-dependent methyltransferase